MRHNKDSADYQLGWNHATKNGTVKKIEARGMYANPFNRNKESTRWENYHCGYWAGYHQTDA